ncbi:MAG: cysteine synthase A [Spirochaetia bacterium]|nr:cysteine synthase A [Spirochaetia bacterium]
MSKIAESILDLVGNTPLVKLNNISPVGANVICKLEFFNPCSSVKDRIGSSMIKAAEESGMVKKETVFIEPTSGNTGIALAWICAAKGYKLILTMPESMSKERVGMLEALGARVILTPAHMGMTGSIQKAEELKKENKSAVILHQFENAANPEIHRKTTALEIWNDTDGEIDIFVAGVGTGGTITGVGEVLKQKKENVQIIAVEPENSAVLSGEEPGPHMIQGIGAGFVPEILNKGVIDDIIKVSNENAIDMAVKLAQQEGIFCGISSGANVHAAIQTAMRPENQGKMIVTMINDSGDRYLTTNLFAKKQA